jgi:ribulose kinase
VYRAILEGISFGTRLIFDAMAANGYSPAEVVVAGGATRSPLWLQIHADVAGVGALYKPNALDPPTACETAWFQLFGPIK